MGINNKNIYLILLKKGIRTMGNNRDITLKVNSDNKIEKIIYFLFFSLDILDKRIAITK
tara:strand:+ start:551 stop:727 length:177 start_codon:yes stop_codon:yes gene_type:complete